MSSSNASNTLYANYATAPHPGSSNAAGYIKTHSRPCVICSMAGNVTDKNDANFRDTVKRGMNTHGALYCPYLPKLAALAGGTPNHYNWPTHSQCGLPPYAELLALRKRKGAPTVTTYPSLSHSDRADKAEKELHALKKRFGVGASSSSSIASAVGTHFNTVNQPKAFVAASNSSLGDLPEVNEGTQDEDPPPDA